MLSLQDLTHFSTDINFYNMPVIIGYKKQISVKTTLTNEQ